MPIKQIKLSFAKQKPVWKLMVIIKSWNLEDWKKILPEAWLKTKKHDRKYVLL